MEIGQRFHRLLVLELLPDKKNQKAKCVCDCGNVVTPQRGALMNGRTKSCGCLRLETLRRGAWYKKGSGKSEIEKKNSAISRARKWAKVVIWVLENGQVNTFRLIAILTALAL